MSDKHDQCSLCGSKALTAAFSLGGDNHWVFCDPEKDPTACGLLQRGFSASGPVMAERSVTRTRRHRLRAAATQLLEMVSARDATALDIGCGEGTLLSFLPRWIDGTGIDETMPAVEANWGTRLQGAFPDPDLISRLTEKNKAGRYDIITAMGVLGNQRKPLDMLQAVSDMLADDGVFMMETPYLPLALMRDNPYAFNPAAEGVYSLEVLEALAGRCGLRIVRGLMSESEGGSLRVFMTHDDFHGLDDRAWLEQLARLWDEEQALDLFRRQSYQTFSWRMERNRQAVAAWVNEALTQEANAWVIGASAGMQATLDWFGIDGRLVSGIVSRDNALEGGEMCLGDGPPVAIVREEEAPDALPDFIIAPACHRRETLEHWREAIFDGAKLVFLTPELQLVDDQSYSMELGKTLAVTDGPGSVDTLRAVLAAVRRPQLVSVSQEKKEA